jgi:hypothetical protein
MFSAATGCAPAFLLASRATDNLRGRSQRPSLHAREVLNINLAAGSPILHPFSAGLNSIHRTLT